MWVVLAANKFDVNSSMHFHNDSWYWVLSSERDSMFELESSFDYSILIFLTNSLLMESYELPRFSI